MGVHFVNAALVGDGEIDVNHPEALIYESKNGTLTLLRTLKQRLCSSTKAKI